MERHSLNSKHRNGSIAELKAAVWYMENGFEVFWPQTPQGAVDFIAMRGQETVRVQVKSPYWFERPSGARYLQATVRKGSSSPYSTYTKEDCDEICLVCDEGVWVIPVECIKEVHTVNLIKGQHERAPRASRRDWSVYKVV